MDYSINVKNQSIPDLISWARGVNARNDAKAKESRDNMMNVLRMAGLAASMGGNNTPVAPNNDAGNSYNYNLAMLGLNPNLMPNRQLRGDGNSYGAF